MNKAIILSLALNQWIMIVVIMGNELKGGNFSVDSSHLIQREGCGFFGSCVTLPRYTVQPHLMNTPFKESPLIPDGAKLNTY